VLKKLELTDFESHQKTTLTFGPGLNVICGKSNHGKSASLRGLELAGYGVWAAGEDKKAGIHGPVRIGEKAAEIYVESDKGHVRVKRAKGTNEWEIHNKESGETLNLKNPGAGSIPEAQEVLGLQSIKIVDSFIRFNWSSQRDKHFLVDEVEGKPSNASFVAAVLDEVGGLSGCEELVRKLASDKTQAEKEMKKAAEAALQADTQLKKFECLDEELERAAQTEKCIDYIEQTHETVSKTRRLRQSFEDLETELKKFAGLESDIKRRKKAEKKLQELDKVADQLARIRSLQEKLTGAKSKLSVATKDYKKAAAIRAEDAGSLCEQVTEKQNLSSRARKAARQLASLQKQINSIEIGKVDFRKAAKHLTKVEETVGKFIDASLQSSSLDDVLNKLSTAESKFEKSTKEANKKKEELEHILDEYELCPFCGQEISEECKKELMEAV